MTKPPDADLCHPASTSVVLRLSFCCHLVIIWLSIGYLIMTTLIPRRLQTFRRFEGTQGITAIILRLFWLLSSLFVHRYIDGLPLKLPENSKSTEFNRMVKSAGYTRQNTLDLFGLFGLFAWSLHSVYSLDLFVRSESGASMQAKLIDYEQSNIERFICLFKNCRTVWKLIKTKISPRS